jgi:hypothetical protein
MNEQNAPAGELTDKQIYTLHDKSRLSILAFARAIITADRELRANGSTVLVPADKLREMQAALAAKDIELSVRGAQFRYMMKDQAAKFDEIARLTAERDALRKDAERYRWLRTDLVSIDVFSASGIALDAAIDAAMTKEPK